MTDLNEDPELDITIVHAPDKYRYELRDGETLIGTAGYLPDSDNETWDFNSTHVDSEYGGRGLAAQLVNFALTDAKAHGHGIVASCSYVVAYLRKHSELA
jgi:predicted GNAT family acetyltransferase